MRPINQCLNPKLKEICLQAIKLEALNDIVSSYLPDAVKNHCRVGSFNKGCLQLLVDDAVWATQLRYDLPLLRDNLRLKAGVYQLVSIKIIVRSLCDDASVAKKARRKLCISETARHNIQSAADKINDESLKRAFQKLITE